MKRQNILILGGARSGKSNFAQYLASKSGEKVLFVATGVALNHEMKKRIQKHKQSRPSEWRTLEVTVHIGEKIRESAYGAQVIIIDCITFLLNNILFECNKINFRNQCKYEELIDRKVRNEITDLLSCMKKLKASFIIISNEVGMGIVPSNKTGRLYRDYLGMINQKLVQSVDKAYLMVSGMPIEIKSPLYGNYEK